MSNLPDRRFWNAEKLGEKKDKARKGWEEILGENTAKAIKVPRVGRKNSLVDSRSFPIWSKRLVVS